MQVLAVVLTLHSRRLASAMRSGCGVRRCGISRASCCMFTEVLQHECTWMARVASRAMEYSSTAALSMLRGWQHRQERLRCARARADICAAANHKRMHVMIAHMHG